MPSAFISYRRLPSAALAQLIARELQEKYGIKTYIDVRQADGSGPFPDRLLRAIEAQDVFVCLLSGSTLESDWVRREIEHAHRLGKIMIPVFQENYVPPEALDEHLSALLQYQGVKVLDTQNLYIDEAIEALAHLIKSGTGRAGRGRLWMGIMIAVLVVVVAILALALLNTGGKKCPVCDTTAVAQTVIAGHEATQTAAALAPTATPVPAGSLNRSWTPFVQKYQDMPFVYVPAGCFMMGSTDEQINGVFQRCEAVRGAGQCDPAWFQDEKPAHKVCLSAYWIGQTEVTNAQYKPCVDAGVCTPPQSQIYYGDPKYADYPVVYVDWSQANVYARWIGGSLPTEAQWEYAARGPEDWAYPWGNEFDGTRLNFCDNQCTQTPHNSSVNDGYAEIAPVGTYPSGASWVGALDMSGNVWEWAADLYGWDYYVSLPGTAVDPLGPPSGDMRVVRGSSWHEAEYLVRAADRYSIIPANSDNNFGFRVARAAGRAYFTLGMRASTVLATSYTLVSR